MQRRLGTDVVHGNLGMKHRWYDSIETIDVRDKSTIDGCP